MQENEKTAEGIIHSPPAAGLWTRALEPNLVNDRRLRKSVSALVPPCFPLAAGRLHITNFDAQFARDAARGRRRKITRVKRKAYHRHVDIERGLQRSPVVHPVRRMVFRP